MPDIFAIQERDSENENPTKIDTFYVTLKKISNVLNKYKRSGTIIIV